MAFLISTSQHLLLLETNRKTVYRVHSGKGLYYGLCLHHGRVIAGCRNRVPSSDDDERGEERGSLLFFDERFGVENEVQPPFPLRDLHGIMSLGDTVWLTCAFDNLVAIFNPTTKIWRKWYPSVDPLARDRDVHHFNTIVNLGDRLALLAHNWGPSHVLFYRYPSLELDMVMPLGVHAHNIFLMDGSLATCSSAEGLLVAESGWRIRTGGFPRGLAATGEARLVGLSRNASREERSVADGVIRVFDDAWRFQTDYVLRGVGMILDILPISIDARALLRLDSWAHLQTYDGQYNPEHPGDSYFPGQQCEQANCWPEWHAAEGSHRWTGACDASMTVTVNPGEDFLTVQAMSGFPEHYVTDVCLDGTSLGQLEFPTAGTTSATFSVKGYAGKQARLSFRVPWLWQPAAHITGSRDARRLGIAVCSVRLSPPRLK
jgi:hypothetical protein